MGIMCPRCFCEDCYFNGVQYECPDCGHTWDPECGFSCDDESDGDLQDFE